MSTHPAAAETRLPDNKGFDQDQDSATNLSSPSEVASTPVEVTQVWGEETVSIDAGFEEKEPEKPPPPSSSWREKMSVLQSHIERVMDERHDFEVEIGRASLKEDKAEVVVSWSDNRITAEKEDEDGILLYFAVKFKAKRGDEGEQRQEENLSSDINNNQNENETDLRRDDDDDDAEGKEKVRYNNGDNENDDDDEGTVIMDGKSGEENDSGHVDFEDEGSTSAVEIDDIAERAKNSWLNEVAVQRNVDRNSLADLFINDKYRKLENIPPAMLGMDALMKNNESSGFEDESTTSDSDSSSARKKKVVRWRERLEEKFDPAKDEKALQLRSRREMHLERVRKRKEAEMARKEAELAQKEAESRKAQEEFRRRRRSASREEGIEGPVGILTSRLPVINVFGQPQQQQQLPPLEPDPTKRTRRNVDVRRLMRRMRTRHVPEPIDLWFGGAKERDRSFNSRCSFRYDRTDLIEGDKHYYFYYQILPKVAAVTVPGA